MKIEIDVWLYGALSRFGGENASTGFAHLKVSLDQGSTIKDLLEQIGIPTEERGFTFINGNLSALPKFQPDLSTILQNGDRVAFFDLKSMWPFQYRQDAPATEEFKQGISNRDDKGIRQIFRDFSDDRR